MINRLNGYEWRECTLRAMFSLRRSDIRDLLNKSLKIFSIHVPLDDLTMILVILREIFEEINCVSFFFFLFKTAFYKLWFYWNVVLFNIFLSWRLVFYTTIIIIKRNTIPLVKGRSRHFSSTVLWLPSCMWASDTTKRSAAVMGRAGDSWRSKPLALVLREIIA